MSLAARHQPPRRRPERPKQCIPPLTINYGGSAAAEMYGGALRYCGTLFPSTLGFLWVAWVHTKEQEYRRKRQFLDTNYRKTNKLEK